MLQNISFKNAKLSAENVSFRDDIGAKIENMSIHISSVGNLQLSVEKTQLFASHNFSSHNTTGKHAHVTEIGEIYNNICCPCCFLSLMSREICTGLSQLRDHYETPWAQNTFHHCATW